MVTALRPGSSQRQALHELAGELAVVLGDLDLVIEDAGLSSAVRASAEEARDAATKAARLLETIRGKNPDAA